MNTQTPAVATARKPRTSIRQRRLTYLRKLLTRQPVKPQKNYPVMFYEKGELELYLPSGHLFCTFNLTTKNIVIFRNWNKEKCPINLWAELTIEALRNLGYKKYVSMSSTSVHTPL